MGLGLFGVQHEAALEPLDCLKGGEVGSARSTKASQREVGYVLTDNEPDRTENAPPWVLGGRLGRSLTPTGS